jgi:Putative peptidoglycan binding domain
MRRIIYSVCIGSLALALTAGAQQVNDRKPQRARPQARAANVHAARPANNGAMMGARHYNSTAQYRQRSYMTPRTRSNAAVSQNARMAAYRDRNFVRNQEFRARNNAAVNRTRNLDVNRERNVAVNRTRNVEMNRVRNANEFRGRNNVAINRNRNVAVNRTGNFAYYGGGAARINNNFRSAAFRGNQYAVFRNYQRQWHDRGWWRSHYNRIVFVSGGWWYWNAGYWFPAWGYDASAYYPYDGPIYGYNGMQPDQVIVDVQQQLQRDGYYDGPVDGVLGPMTREAIAAFQADNGLSVTSVIDEPTLATLGIA